MSILTYWAKILGKINALRKNSELRRKPISKLRREAPQLTFVPVRNHWETCGHGFEWVGDRLKIEYG